MNTYRRLAARQPVDVDAERNELAELAAWRMVAADPDLPAVPVVLDPREAARVCLQAGIRRLADQAAELAAVPGVVESLSGAWEASRAPSAGGSEYLTDPAEVNARIQDALNEAEGEMLTAQPSGPRSRALLDLAEARDAAALERGVRIRTLYQDRVRDDAVTRDWAQRMAPRGVQYRTLTSPFQRCIIIDRRQAFVSDHAVPGGPAHAARHVTDAGMVAFIAEVFEDAWRRADPWHGQNRSGAASQAGAGVGAGVTTGRQRAICRDIAAGLPHRLIASRMQVSERTLTNEIAAIRALWGAGTIAELVYAWAKSPDSLIDELAAAESSAEAGVSAA